MQRPDPCKNRENPIIFIFEPKKVGGNPTHGHKRKGRESIKLNKVGKQRIQYWQC